MVCSLPYGLESIITKHLVTCKKSIFWPAPRDGCTLIFYYIRRLGPSVWVKNFELQFFFFFFLGGGMNIFFVSGYVDFVDIFGGHHKLTIFRGHFYAF